MIFCHRTIVLGIIYEVSLPKGYRHPGSAEFHCFCGNVGVVHVQLASKYRNCTCPSSFRFAVVYNYTRKIPHCGDSDVYLFIPKTSALGYGCPNLRNRLVTKPKSLKHMYIFDRIVDFVHESRRFSRVSGGCIFTHPAAYLSAMNSLYHGLLTFVMS